MWQSQCAGLKQLDDGRIKFACPLNPDHVVVGRPLGRIYHLLCLGDCPTDQVLDALGITQSDLTIGPPSSQEPPAIERKPPQESFSGNGTSHRPKVAPRHAYALAYAKYGIPVFPLHEREADGECSCGKLQCESLGKHPRHKGWQEEATILPEKIRAFWDENPTANIGVACGKVANLTVLDVDGEEGRETLRNLELEHGELPETPRVITGRGGEHYYFQHIPGAQNAVRFASGLDIRTDGGLVVGVGSRTTGEYAWEASATISESFRPAVAPEWLADLMRQSQTRNGGRVTVPAPAEMVEGSGRHTKLWQIGRSMKAQKFPESAIRAALTSTNAEFAQPLGKSELNPLIEDIWTRGDRYDFLPTTTNGHLPAEEIDPDLILRPLDLTALYTMLDEWLKVPWVWQGILPHGSLSLLVGKSESGKSTFVYALIYCIVNGLTFLGRLCEKGRVLYLAGDPASEFVAAQTFRALGLTDDVLVIRGALVGNPYAWQQFRQIVNDFQPTLIVLDTLSAAVNLDTEKYGQSQQVQQPLTKLARDFNPNILSLHHSQKSAIEAYNVVDAALGSVGVAAVASTRMVTRSYRRGGKTYHTFEMSNLRIGQPLEGEWILEKHEDGLVELGSLWNQRESKIFEEAILNVVKDSPDDRPPTQSDIRDRIGMKISRGMLAKKLSELVKDGKLDMISKGAKKYTLGGA